MSNHTIIPSVGSLEHTVHPVHTSAPFSGWLHTFRGVVHSTFGASHRRQRDECRIEFSRKNCARLYFRFLEGRSGAQEGAHDEFCAHFYPTDLMLCAQSAHPPYLVHTLCILETVSAHLMFTLLKMSTTGVHKEGPPEYSAQHLASSCSLHCTQSHKQIQHPSS